LTEDSIQQVVLRLRNRAPWDLVYRCVEGVEYLDEYDPEGQPLRRIQLRSPPHRVAGIDRHDEIQSKNLELRRGRCKRRRERS